MVPTRVKACLFEQLHFPRQHGRPGLVRCVRVLVLLCFTTHLTRHDKVRAPMATPDDPLRDELGLHIFLILLSMSSIHL